MKTENVELMRRAKETMQGQWGISIGAFVVYIIIPMALGIIPVLGSIASFLIAGPFFLGLAIFTLNVSRRNSPKIDQLFEGFDNFGRSLGAYFFISIRVLLFLILLIIPGIIVGLSYSMTFFILADDKTIGYSEAMNKSKQMMEGNKLKYFYLQLRIFGLVLLCILTLGIGLLWLYPYASVCSAKFYDELNGEIQANKTI